MIFVTSTGKSELSFVSSRKFVMYFYTTCAPVTVLAFILEVSWVNRLKYFSSCISVIEDRGSTLVKVQYYKSEGRWFDPSWCPWIFH